VDLYSASIVLPANYNVPATTL